jgi:predicted phage tail protein
VEAQNLAGDSATGTVGFVTTLPTFPGAPSSPSASSMTDISIDLAWIPSSNGGSPITNYTLQQSSDDIHFTTIFTGTATSFNATGLTSGSTYYFQVYATNSIGNSPNSTVASFTILGKSNFVLPL